MKKVHSSFIDNIWGTDFADMQLISKFNKKIRFLLCVIDIFTKCAWIIPLKDERGITINNDFQKVLDESKRKPNIIWIDKGSKSYNRTMKSEIEESEIEMYLTHDEGKSFVAGRFIKTSKNEIHKYMTSISKNMYIDKLNIVNKYNNIYHTTIKKNPSALNQAYILTLNKENNKEGSNFKVGDIVRISKYKNIFAKGFVPNWSEEVFVIKKVNVICDVKSEETAPTFYEK